MTCSSIQEISVGSQQPPVSTLSISQEAAGPSQLIQSSNASMVRSFGNADLPLSDHMDLFLEFLSHDSELLAVLHQQEEVVTLQEADVAEFPSANQDPSV